MSGAEGGHPTENLDTPDALSETVPVREAHRFDTTRLEELLGNRMGARLLDLRQMRGGQSNPTFLLVTDKGEGGLALADYLIRNDLV